MRARREKLAALTAKGVSAFGYGYARTHLASAIPAALGDADEGPEVRVAGRIVAWRAHGKTTFAHLGDSSGRVQLYFKQDIIGAGDCFRCDIAGDI